VRAVHRFWFVPETPLTPPLLRIVLGAYLLGVLLPGDLRQLQREAGQLTAFIKPSALLNALGFPLPIPADVVLPFAMIMMVLGVLVTIGLATRPALLLFALGYWFIGTQFSAWGWYTHSRAIPVQALAVLAFAPGATAWSADRFLAWAWRRRRGTPASLSAALTGPAVPRWGTQLILVLLAAMFFSAGISKLRHSGLRWADGQTLGFCLSGKSIGAPKPAETRDPALPPTQPERFSLLAGPPHVPPELAWRDGFGLENYLYVVNPEDPELGRAVARRPWLLVALSVASLVFELTAPLLLVTRRLRNIYLVGAVGFLMGIYLLMGVNFQTWMVIALCAVDWDWIAESLRAGLGRLWSVRPPAASPLERTYGTWL
jgi:uncharacterized membrane protein YphA (DoxX/SURF4 family)